MSHGHNLIRSSTIVSEAVLTPPTLPGFYPHSDGPLRARCRLGSDLKPRSITTMMDLGCWDAAIYPAISKGSAGFSQSSEQGGGCHCQSTLEKQIVSKTNKTDLCFPSTQQPIRLSFLDFRSPGAHRLRRSTRADAVRWQVFAPLRQMLVSWRSFLHAGRVSFRIVVSLCPARTGPGCSARYQPAVYAASGRQPC